MPVYALVSGTLMEVRVKPGDKVTRGQVIAVMQNDDLRLSVEELERAVEMYRQQIEYFHRASCWIPAARREFPRRPRR